MLWVRRISSRTQRGWLLSLAACISAGAAAAEIEYEPIEARIDPEKLEENNARIGQVNLLPENIFDLDNPAEDKWLYRLANGLHVVTRPRVIKSQLLFAEGDRYSKRLVDESERILRQNAYLRDAQIEPIKYDNGVVDLLVNTTDTWTLTPSISAGRSGGENRLGLGIKEQNLFGTGVHLGFKYKQTVDRDITTLDYADRNLGGSRYQLAARLSDNSDGYVGHVYLAKPFFALDARDARGMSLLGEERIDPLYERGEIISDFKHRLQHHELFAGWSRGLRDGWTRRFYAGLVYDDHQFSATPNTILADALVPADRRYIYPYLAFEMVEDHYQESVNFDRINIIEDRYLGTRFSFRVGYASESMGSSNDAWLFRGEFSNALVATNSNSLVLATNLNGRYEDGDGQNVLLSGGGRFHHKWSKHHLFYLSLHGTVGRNVDLDNQLLLGGDNGLRGYPLRYQGGDRMALLTVEHRIFTEWYPFRLFNVGGAVFFDAGRTWGENPVGAANLGLLRDVGVGLRLGNNRSGNGKVIHIDVAFPLDGEADIDSVQLLIDAKASF